MSSHLFFRDDQQGGNTNASALHISQQAVYYDQLLDPDSPHYNVGGYIHIKGALNLPCFYQALQSLPTAFDIFRLQFDFSGETPQCVFGHETRTIPFEEMDFSQNNDPHQEALAWIQGRYNLAFDLQNNQVAEFALLKLQEDEYFWYLRYHHILVDGHGCALLNRFVSDRYTELLNDQIDVTHSVPPYEAVIEKSLDYLHSTQYQDDEAYWKAQYHPLPEPLLQVQKNQQGQGKRFRVNVSIEQKRQLEATAKQAGGSPQHLLLAALTIYFGRIQNRSDIVVGVPIHKRSGRQERRIPGMFSGVIPFKGQHQNQQTVGDLIKTIKQQQRQDYRHLKYPISHLNRALNLMAKDRQQLFDLILIYDLLDFDYEFGGLENNFRQLSSNAGKTPLELRWCNYKEGEPIELNIDYNDQYFSEADIQLFSQQFLFILDQFQEGLDRPIAKIEILTQAEKDQQLIDFNNTNHFYPKDKTLVDLFEEQVQLHPAQLAVCYESQSLSYQALNEKANQLAHYLNKQGLAKESLVALRIQRSPEMIIAILGILKAGAAYVPIDPDYPQERMDFILKDTQTQWLISDSDDSLVLDKHPDLQVISLSRDSSKIERESTAALKRSIAPNQLAYVIYTSGSSGQPKGVMLEHGGAVNMSLFHVKQLNIDKTDRVLQFTSLSFDVSVCEIFMTLHAGATLVLLNQSIIAEEDAFCRYLQEQQVSIATIPAAFLNVLQLDQLSFLKVILSGGEAANVKQVTTAARFCQFFNAYGPTECTVCSSIYQVQAADANKDQIPIGRPVANAQIYILNQAQQLLPLGSEGEICISGVGLARAYLFREALTNEKFISHPFRKGERLYRTGDKGKWLADGNIAFLGRIDDQVKIRGFRVELGEIETALLQYSFIQQACVIAPTDANGNKRLVAYVVAGAGYKIELLEAYLQERLPHYMLPSLTIELEEMPLTSNGKIDKKALPEPDATQQSSSASIAPRTETEQQLAILWKTLLPIQSVGIYDHFFRLGGNSLLATKIASLIRKKWAVNINTKDIFDHPTIAGLANYVDQQEGGSTVVQVLPQPRPAQIPLSFPQERLWFIDSFSGSQNYHISMVLNLDGSLDIDLLETAFREVIQRHEVLRTVYVENDGQAFQQVLSANQWQLNRSNQKGENEEWIKSTINEAFDLSKDYMLRAHLMTQSTTVHQLVLVMHHIAADGWSIPILLDEFYKIYQAKLQNQTVVLPALDLQYIDYALWQRQSLTDAVLQSKLKYWEQQLQGITALNLPTDFARPARQSTSGSHLLLKVNTQQKEALKNLAQKEGVTPFILLLTAFKVLLFRHSGQADICVGSPIANRSQSALESLIGFFVNTLVLRSQLEPQQSFRQLLQQVKATNLEAYAHYDVPFEKIVDRVEKKRDLSKSPLFQVMFVYQNSLVPNFQLDDLSIDIQPYVDDTSMFDLSFNVNETATELELYITYCNDLFSPTTIQRMGEHYQNLLSQIITDADQAIAQMPMLAPTEEHQLLQLFNDTQTAYPKEKTFVDLFEEQVARTPDQVAVFFEGQEMTYLDLHQRSNQLAHYLIQKGVKEDTLVAISVDRSLEMIVGLVSILKSGGAYVPIDPDYPQERINYIIEDSNTHFFVSNNGHDVLVKDQTNVQMIALDEDWSNIAKCPLTSPVTDLQSGHTAYVIYTSGSTGKPKGVVISHTSLVNIALCWQKEYQLDSDTRLLQMVSFSFDVFSGDLCRSLLFGGQMVLCSANIRLDSAGLYELIAERKTNILEVTPALAVPLMDYIYENGLDLSWMKLLILGSDVCPVVDFQRLLQRFGQDMRIINSYGTTETTIDSSYYETKDPASLAHLAHVPIGKPLQNNTFYILNSSMALVPIGVIGELYIGGAGLAKAYLNKAELTQSRFIAHPFQKGERIYKTGDLARWLPDGNVDFLGRSDSQVKIHGYRIELGEIETVLQQSPLVQQGVVLSKEDQQGDKRLVAYIVAEGVFDRKTIQAFLKAQLPGYMVPALLVPLDKMPLTPNGKIDKKALPNPDASQLIANEYIAARNPMEEALVDIWKGLLKVKKIGILDDFFELGGHSLLATRVVSAIRKEMKIDLSIPDLFEKSTIETLASYLSTKQQNNNPLPELKPQKRPEKLPLSFAQEQIWVIDQLEGSGHYHMPSIFRLKGQLDPTVLEESFRSIVDRHEVLRTVFKDEDGQAYQEVLPAGQWTIDFKDLSSNKDQALADQWIDQSIHQAFDLSQDHLLRVLLLKITEEEHLLVTVFHHLAADGWSVSIFVNELVEFYTSKLNKQQAALSPLPIQYADYALWQRQFLSKTHLEEKLTYWENKLKGVGTLDFPTDFPRPAVQSTKGKLRNYTIDLALQTHLQQFAQQQSVTVFMLLLAAFKVLLHRYSGQEDLCIGSPSANRTHSAIEPMIGYFINILALRSQVSGELRFDDLLAQIKKTTLEAYQHQEVPFDKIVDRVEQTRDRSRNPLFQAMFVLQNNPETPLLQLGEVTLSQEPVNYETAKFDLTFNAFEGTDGMDIAIEYCTDLFLEESIDRMMNHFENLLKAIVAQPNEKLNRLEMVAQTERQQLLQVFNDNHVKYPKDQSILHLFEKQVELHPDKVALYFENSTYTYLELNARSNQLAHYLKKQYAIQSNDLVAIQLSQGIDLILVIFGVLKSGAAYVPIDQKYPTNRIQYILEDSQSKLVIDEEELTKFKNNQAQYPTSNSILPIELQSLAYTFYTSGSTGKPKGVMISHQSLSDRLYALKGWLDVDQTMVACQLTNYVFDISLLEIFLPLISGGSLFIPNRNDIFQPEVLLDGIIKMGVNELNGTPGIVTPIIKAIESHHVGQLKLKQIALGGESLPEQLVQLIREKLPNVCISNLYGPTEATIYAIVNKNIQSFKRNIIGWPLANARIYILDKNDNPVPLGVKGEIYIGGEGLAEAYLNKAQLSAEKFIANPFVAGERMYRTGDIGRWLTDGSIEFFGREDDQVKIRGFRIELGEIESILHQSESVKQSIVLAQDDPSGNKRLVAYIIPKGPFDKAKIQADLKTQLPDYMVPHLMIEMEHFPLTPNGKTDRKALPAPDSSQLLSNQFVAPKNEIEEQLVEIWQELLQLDSIGTLDNFFELGGDSIITIQVVSRAKRMGLQLQPRDIFEHQTVASLAKIILANDQKNSRAEQHHLSGAAPLLPIQQRFLEQENANPNHYNQATLLQISKTVPESHLQQSIEALINQHDALRFSYIQKGKQWQQNYNASSSKLLIEDLSHLSPTEVTEGITTICQKHQESLDIESGPLFRFVWIKTNEGIKHHRLFMVVHHLAIDGVSWRILLDQLEISLHQLTEGKSIDLGQKTNAYRQWSEALLNLSHSKAIVAQTDYWTKVTQQAFTLPLDKKSNNNSPAKFEDLQSQVVYLNKKQTRAFLQKANRAYQTHTNDLLLTALLQSINQWTKQNHITIGLEGHGREDLLDQLDISSTVGWFTNLYPLSLQLPATATTGQIIKSVKEQIRAVPQKGMAYGLLRYHHPNEKIRQQLANSEVEIIFNYLGQTDNLIAPDSMLQLASEASGSTVSPQAPFHQKLEINAYVTQGRLAIEWSYSSKQFYKKTIASIAKAYLNNLDQLIDHCTEKEGIELSPSNYGLAPQVQVLELDQFLNHPENGLPRREQIESLSRLSPMQEGMLFHSLYDQQSSAYTEQFVFDCKATIQVSSFKTAWQQLLKEFPILRTRFFAKQLSIPVQAVYSQVDLPFEFLDLTSFSKAEQADQIQQFLAEDVKKGFDFETAPLMRVSLIQLRKDVYQIIWTHHHILLDGWSIPILMKRLFAAYESLVKGNTLVDQSPDHYRDYIQYLGTIDSIKEQDFWQNYLNGFETPSLLPFVPHLANRNKGSNAFGSMDLVLDADFTEQIKAFAKAQHLTVNTIVQGIWGILLARYTNNPDCLFGVTVSGRPTQLERAEQRVGLYINTLPLRSTVRSQQSIKDFLSTIQRGHTRARTFQYTALNSIQNWSGIQGDFFDSIIVFENYPIDEVFSDEYTLQVNDVQAREKSNYLLTLSVMLGRTLDIGFHYNSALLDTIDVERIRGHFKTVFQQIVVDQVTQVDAIDPIGEEEKNQLLHVFNRPAVAYPKDKTVLDVFEKWVQTQGDHTALVFQDQTWTYRELDEQANKVAAYLQSQYQVESGDIVGILLNRSGRMIISMLGVLKAGASYLPIGVDHPLERKNFMIEDARLKALITASNIPEIDALAISPFLIDSAVFTTDHSVLQPVAIQPQNPVYVIYTSGTTGRPKGVLVNHQNLLNLTQATANIRHLPTDRVLQWSNFSFDGSVLEIFSTLLNGASLYLITEGEAYDPIRLKALMLKHQITWAFFTTALFNTFVDSGIDELSHLRRLCFGGEAGSIDQARKAVQILGSHKVYNFYGPTETTVLATYFLIPTNPIDVLPIGRPLSNIHIYIVNSQGQLSGVGVVGEIWIAGDSTSMGYLNRPELTATKFIADPFNSEQGASLYKTGDLGRWLPDGTIEFLGRKDNQVKISGYRIELEAIQKVLQQLPLIQEAVVVVKTDRLMSKRLVAYLVGSEDLDLEDIKMQLKAKLPSFMVPHLFMVLEQMPLTSNGKIDQRALPEPNADALTQKDYVAPRNEVETQLADIWSHLLALPKIGINENFFDLGGHSILAIRVASAIGKTFSIDISIQSLFKHTTIEDLAQFVQQQKPTQELIKIEKAAPSNRIPLSFAQERLWFIHQLQGSTQYHLTFIIQIKGQVNESALANAFQTIVERHEILRSIIEVDEEHAFQKVKAANLWNMQVLPKIPRQQTIGEYYDSFIQQPFDLTQEFPLRVELIQSQEQEYFLMAVLHHIAGDGWSNAIMVNELVHLYESYDRGISPSLPELPIQYADFAIWQRHNDQAIAVDQQLAYWTKQLADLNPLELPTDFPRPAVQSINGARCQIKLPKSTSDQLEQLARQQDVSGFMLFLSALQMLLFKYTDQKDICIGTPIAGRTTKEIESLIGFFVNMLSIRTIIDEQSSFIDLLQSVKQTMLESFANQTLPFERIVEAVGVQRDQSRNPIFQVTLTYEKTSKQDRLQLHNLQIHEHFIDNTVTTAQRDLSFSAKQEEDGFEIELIYATDLYRAETMERLLVHFSHLLQSIANQPTETIAQLSMISAAEKEQLLVQFNDSDLPYPKEESVIHLFEKQVAQTPDHLAVIFGDIQLTYAQLNQKANQLAHQLIEEYHIQNHDFVGILMDRSEWMIIACLGILKTGAAYVPINPDYPLDRKEFMIEDAQMKVLLIHSDQLLDFADLDVALFSIDLQLNNKVKQTNLQHTVNAKDPAYVMYTSGTTGQPKGIVVNQRNIVKLSHEKNDICIQATDRVLQWSNFAFDGSTYEIFNTLLNGATLCLITAKDAPDPSRLAKIIQQHQVTVCFLTTALFNAFVELDLPTLKGLRKLLFGGELVSVAHVKKALSALGPNKLIHVYGPTETTVYATFYPINTIENEQVPIGQPLSNTQIYVVNTAGQLAGVGVTGEIWIGGDGVANGYLNHPSLTAEKFSLNPFSNNGDRLYKTGDLGRLLADGNLDFIGRKDNQVKIRGYRIELGEIETTIRKSPMIHQVIVLTTSDASGTKRLVAYVVGKNNFDKTQLQIDLKKQLPEYMVPSLIMELAELPLNTNGKIDQKALPFIDPSALIEQAYVEPRNELEKQLADIWKRLLKVEKVGVHDNFFDLGGHSLLATRVVSAIRKQLNIDLAITVLFNQSTIAQLAEWIQRAERTSALPAITLEERPEQIPLSFAQERLWFIHQLEGSSHYHMPAQFTIKGKVDPTLLETVFQQIVNRHEVLRTVFKDDDGRAYQIILPSNQWHFEKNIAFANPQEREIAIDQLIHRPFDLKAEHMLRAQLIPVSEEEYLLILVLHHIASDGWSHSVFVRELLELYEAKTIQRPHQLATLDIQYADFALWQRRHLAGETLETKLTYWEQQLQGLSTLNLPLDYNRPKEQSSRGNAVDFLIDRSTSDQLTALAQAEGVTLFMLLLSIFKVLLYRYSGQEDICVGSPIANRTQEEVEPLIGFFVNTLALRSDLSGNPIFTDVLAQVKATTLTAYNHQDVPFEKIVDRVERRRDQSRSPIFQVMFVLQNNPEVPEIQLGDLTFIAEPTDYQPSKFDLTFSATETETGLDINLAYCSDLFAPASIERMVQHFQLLLQSVLKQPNQNINQLSLLDTGERETLIHRFNQTTVAHPTENSLAQLFEKQVQLHPEKIAVVFDTEALTYQALHEKSNQVAQYLQAQGVQAQELVAVCMERSIHWLTAILGIVKSGAAYVPIDPAYPQERIQYLLDDTQTKYLCSDPNNEKLDAITIPLTRLVLDKNWMGFTSAKKESPTQYSLANHLAYVIYTSGSTGQPKGVMVEQQSVCNLVYWHNQRYQVNEHSRATVMAGVGFDASVWEVWPYLLTGASLYLLNDEDRLATESLLKFYAQHQITHSFQPTVLVSDFIEASKTHALDLQYLLTGGDSLPPVDVRGLSYRLVNNYGPTENTVVASAYEVQAKDAERKPLIGQAIDNVQIYLLDAFGQLVPHGVIGELYIGGNGIARGYLNRPQLTTQQFIDHPFSDHPKAKLYKTGDLARQLADGNIEYLGRVDDQVQIRGHRIELGEIESILQQSTSISQSVVLVKNDSEENKRLVAYVVADESLNKTQLQETLKLKLPAYMVPSLIIVLAQLPLTANGKINKKALPDPDFTEVQQQKYVAPRDEVEIHLAKIWQQLLSVKDIGIYDNFFDLGGHSLVATRLVSAIRKQLHAEVNVKTIFAHPTVITLANFIRTEATESSMAIVAEERPTQIPLSFSQERLWFIDRMEGSTHYHMPAAFQLKGELDSNALKNAFQAVVNRHEILRTVYIEDKGQVAQKVLPKNQWDFTASNSNVPQQSEKLQDFITTESNKAFDLSKDSMLRAQLCPLGNQEHLLIIVLHHIASDGWSMPIFVKELMAFYQSYKKENTPDLNDLSIQYADYALWQRKHLQGAVLEEKMKYWGNKLADLAPLELPTDFPRPSVQSTKGKLSNFSIDKTIWSALKAIARKEGATDFMLLLTVFKILLHRYTGQEDICVGTPMANRTQSEVEPLIGFFINTLALRTQVSDNPSFKTLLQQVKTTTLEAYTHQDTPFEKIVEQVEQTRDLSRTPLFQVMFSLANNEGIPTMETEGLSFTPISAEFDHAKYDLTFMADETVEGLSINVNFCSDLFRLERIEKMQQHFQLLLAEVVAHPEQKIGTLRMISEEEEKELLFEFNQPFIPSPFPKGQTVVDLFEQQAKERPNRIALASDEGSLSYEALDKRSNQLAHYLQKRNVQANTIVAVCMNRSIDMIVSILAILKVGAAYVPIDPAYPDERIKYILEDTQTQFVILQQSSGDFKVKREQVKSISITEVWSTIAKESKSALSKTIDPEQLAYVIYTSGSTGKPKGVMIRHRSLLNLIHWHCDVYEVTAKSNATLMAGVGFDASVWELWPYLTSGSSLFIIKDEDRLSPDRLMEIYQEHQITHTFQATILVPEFVRLSRHQELPLEFLSTGGDSLAPIDIEGLSYRLVNNYGPTENTVVASYYELNLSDKGKMPSIGKAVYNTQIYLLDQYKNLVPLGVNGEMYLGGTSLAKGYFNRKKLTQEKFISNPFGDQENDRLYGTGDLASWSIDGNLNFAGRKDEQVQIRGYRIELGEIEETLQKHEDVNGVLVLAKANSSGDKSLIAYLLSETTLQLADLRDYLSKQLPYYMVPAHFIQIDQFPLTPNGKVDKKALPEPSDAALETGVEYVAPRNETEEQLTEIWEELLSIPKEKISIDDNFFDLGGHSMKLVRFNHLLKEKMTWEISMVDMFKFGSIRSLSDHFNENSISDESNDEERADSASLFENTLNLFNND